MNSLLDSLIDKLSSAWKAPVVPTTKRAYRCDCGRPVFFLNTQCLGCGAALGYEPTLGEVRALHAGDEPDTWRPSGAGDDTGQAYRRCANFHSPASCNWMVPAGHTSSLCLACRLNRAIPDLEDPDNQRYWNDIEAAKRRLISQLLGLGLPVESKEENPEQGVAFELLRPSPDGPKVLTGHANGLITINVEEADDVKREQIRTSLHEPYRTLLGHFRHEIGHYYWDRLVSRTRWLEPYRALFGDERADYAAALKANYENGPPADWRDRHISAYASSHPWEDWAETWAHFLHAVDSLDTAISHGFEGGDMEIALEPFTRDDLYDPDHPSAERELFLFNSWMELVTVLNEIGRSMGQPDLYPFVISRPVVKKLHFVSLVVADARAVTDD